MYIRSEWFGIVNGYHFSARHTSVFSFPDDNLSKISIGFHQTICALILWRSGFGLLIDKLYQFLTELSARHTSVLSFPDDNKRFIVNQSIYTKLGVCIDIMEVWFEFLMGKIRYFLTELSTRHT